MSLALITSVASLAMEYGPAAIRGISSLFGGSETADKVADAVEKADAMFGATKEQKELAVTRELQNLPPEALIELEKIKVELEKQKTRRQELELNDKQAEHHETQTTIRNGDNAQDEYVRQTRPKMARQSFALMVLYIVGMEVLKAMNFGTGADTYLALTIGTPAFAYLGLRTVDGFAPYSKSSGDKVAGAIGNVIKGRK
ncbi:hypothetical protein V9G51_001987 [Vibrio cholerae]